jgi:hypothetical protein
LKEKEKKTRLKHNPLDSVANGGEALEPGWKGNKRAENKSTSACLVIESIKMEALLLNDPEYDWMGDC